VVPAGPREVRADPIPHHAIPRIRSGIYGGIDPLKGDPHTEGAIVASANRLPPFGDRVL